jgi:hypothetical protein
MNLFYLDTDHDLNAQYHVDKHVVKMVLEACEMICQAYWVKAAIGFVPRILTKEEYQEVVKYRGPYKSVEIEDRPIPYMGRDMHLNHPSTVWVRSSAENLAWTYCYAQSLDAERVYRNPNGVKQHKALGLTYKLPDLDIPNTGFTKFALAMKSLAHVHPELYFPDDPIRSYRNFYMKDKGPFATWKSRPKPPWWDEELANYDGRLKYDAKIHKI